MKKLSVITICYNEPNLRDTCESIINQTWQDFEWIVIDGGSNKQTQEIWDKYKFRINKFISEPDEGIYSAMNKGIRLAQGEFLNFMNAGDSFYNFDVLYNIKNLLNKKNDIIYGNSFYFFPSEPRKNTLKIFPKEINKEFFIFDNLNTQAIFVRKSLFPQYGYFDTSYKVSADWDRWLKFITEKKKFVSTQHIIAKYCMEGLSNCVDYKTELQNIQNKYFTQEELYKIKNKPAKNDYTLIEEIFSIKNSSDKKHKIITIFGIHIKIKRENI